MKNLICLFLLVLVCFACEQKKEAPVNSVKEALYDIFEEEKVYSQKEFPSWSDVESEDLYQDLSIEGYQKRGEKWKGILAKAEKIDKSALDRQDKINLDMFLFILKDRIAQIDMETYLTPISADGGFHVNFVYMRNYFPFNKLEQYERYVKVLGSFKDYANDNIELLKEGLKKGRSLPKAVLQGYESYIDPHIVEKATDSYFYEPMLNIPDYIPESKAEELRRATEDAIMNSVVEGYQTFKDYLQNEYRPNAADAVGITQQPGGEEIYQQRIEYFTTLPLTADDIFETGQKEVARIKNDMMGIIEEVGFEGSFGDFLQFLRTDPQFYARTPRELLMEASYHSKNVDGRLPEYFGIIPRLPYGVEPVPDAIAPKYTSGRYVPGSERDHKSGTYWVNTFKLKSRPLYVLPALTLHEAVPGHHLQISLAAEMDEVPDFRKETYLSCYGEGWALYCEWLGQEMGIFQTPYEHFGRMTYEMWRACRLVVDVGLHAKGWTRDQAVDFMASNTALSLHEVNTEIDRYIGWPGQAISYKIGELKIRELRQKAEAALKDKFDIRTFHDVILENGSVPLFVLEELVDEYIQNSK